MTRRPVDQAGYTVARHRTQLLWEQLDDAIARDTTGDTMVETPTPEPTPAPQPQPQPDPTTPPPSPTQPR